MAAATEARAPVPLLAGASNTFDCENAGSPQQSAGKHQVSQTKKYASFIVVSLVLGAFGGMVGYFALGPLVAQNHNGINMATHGLCFSKAMAKASTADTEHTVDKTNNAELGVTPSNLQHVAKFAAAGQPVTRFGGLIARPTRQQTALRMSDVLVDEEEAQIMESAEQIAKKKRSNLYNENGVAYAPWMVRQVDEDAVATARATRAYEKRRERMKLEEKQGTVNILDSATSELTGLGLKAKVLSDEEVELVWSTDDEEANRGFLVERKAVGYSDWVEIASYTSWSPLKSKGTLGGAYKYVDATASEGEFLYRIVAEQSDNTRAIVCQVGVAVETGGQQLQTKIVVGLFAVLGLAALVGGALLDPIKG